MEKILKKLGLDNKEIAIYLTLIEYGPRPASFIAGKTKLNRSSIYYLVDELVKKQIILQSDRAGVIYFAVGDPADLVLYLEKEQSKLKRLTLDVTEALPELEALQNHLSSWKPKFYYFQGQTEVRNLLEKTLQNKGKQLWSLLSMADVYGEFGEEHFEAYIKRRIDKGIHLQVIRSDDKDIHKERWKPGEAEIRTTRHLPKAVSPPDMSFYLWDQKYCAFLSSQKENYGLLIESEEFFQTQKMLFDSLWSISGE